MTSSKKVRCTCARCGKVKYLPATGIDLSEGFLCEPCDDKYIVWCNTNDMCLDPLAQFLKARPVR